MLTSANGMAPGTRRLAVSQGALRFVDGVGGVLEIDPDVGGQTHLHRPREHFNGGVLFASPTRLRAARSLLRLALSETSSSRGGASGQTTRDQFVFADRPVPLRRQKREGETPLAPGEVALLDQHVAMLEARSARSGRCARSPRFCQPPRKVPEIECAYITS